MDNEWYTMESSLWGEAQCWGGQSDNRVRSYNWVKSKRFAHCPQQKTNICHLFTCWHCKQPFLQIVWIWHLRPRFTSRLLLKASDWFKISACSTSWNPFPISSSWKNSGQQVLKLSESDNHPMCAEVRRKASISLKLSFSILFACTS